MKRKDVTDEEVGVCFIGTDLPVWQAHENSGLTMRYRKSIQRFYSIWRFDMPDFAFNKRGQTLFGVRL